MKIKIKEGGPPGRRALPSKKVTYFKTAACLGVDHLRPPLLRSWPAVRRSYGGFGAAATVSGEWAAAPARRGWVLALLEVEGEGVAPPGWLGNEEGMEN